MSPRTLAAALAAFLLSASLGAALPESFAAAKAAFEAKDFAGAEAKFATASLEAPGEAQVWNFLGLTRWKLGQREQALEAYEKCLQLNPDQPALKKFLADQRAASGKPAAGEDSPAKPKSRTRPWVSPLWRSALLPGWGQVYNGEKTKGLVIGSAALSTYLVSLTAFVIATQAQKDYQNLPGGLPQGSYDDPYNRWSTWAGVNYISYAIFAGLYTYNLLDAVWGAKQPAVSLAPEAGESRLSFALLGDGLQARLELARF